MLVNDKELRDKFMKQAAIAVLGNQLPVGVFDRSANGGRDFLPVRLVRSTFGVLTVKGIASLACLS